MLPLLSLAPGSKLLAPLPEYPLSRASDVGTAFFAAGRFAGGAGGAALARPPLAAGRVGGAGGGGVGLFTTSSRYADGVHPEADLSNLLASHHPIATLVYDVLIDSQINIPLPSFCVTSIVSPFVILSSPADCPRKSYRAR